MELSWFESIQVLQNCKQLFQKYSFKISCNEDKLGLMFRSVLNFHLRVYSLPITTKAALRQLSRVWAMISYATPENSDRHRSSIQVKFPSEGLTSGDSNYFMISIL